MPKYNIRGAVTITTGGKPRTLKGDGVTLDAKLGDALVARRQATKCPEPKAPAREEPEVVQDGDGERFKAQHKGGGHYTVIDSETGQPAIEDTMTKEEAQAKAKELSAAE